LKIRPLDAAFKSIASRAIFRGMTDKRLPRPRDPVQLAKLIGDILTGQVEDRAPDAPPDPNKDSAAVALGRKGGLKGGRARADSLTPEERKKTAQDAAKKRWHRGF
jgi:hypothetical protein